MFSNKVFVEKHIGSVKYDKLSSKLCTKLIYASKNVTDPKNL